MRTRELAAILTLALLVPATSASATTGPALSVDAAAARHAISPYIYGWNFAPMDLAAQIDLPVDRRGGNSADTLNWQTGTQNTSNDYFFEDTPWCWDTTYNYCTVDGSHADGFHAYTDQIDADRVVHAKTLIDVPMMDYVAADPANYVQPLPCSFPKTVFATQDAFDPYDTNCGNGVHNGNYVTNTPQTADAVTNNPAFEGAWIDDLKSRYGTAADGGVAFYELGNEPALWDDTHHDWHPSPTTYDELRDKTIALGAEIKSRDPSAQVLGFSEWGWPNYFCSALDNTSNGCDANDTDRGAHGGTELAAWLLQQWKAYADTHGGQRIVDYFDLHYYRQDDNGSAGFRATRSLWDPTYTDESWINANIDLLPRMHNWVDQNYPGTKISLSEYDMSFGTATQDNLVQADTLGIFGREGLDLATLFPLQSTDHYADAFRFFRNYDGNHSEFGDTSVSSTSADQSQLAIYGAQRSSDGALTLAVVNKADSDLTSTLNVSNFAVGGPAQVWRWTTAGGAISRQADQTVGPSGFTATFPAQSLTMIVIPASAPPPAAGGGGGTGTQTTPVTGTTGAGSSPSTATGCKVPRVIGLTLKKAKTRLRKAHCAVGKVTRKRSRKRKGVVIAQAPKAGKHLRRGAKVALVLSRGR